MDLASGRAVGARGGWGGGSDSYYEYLLKMWVYAPRRCAGYRDAWLRAVDATLARLVGRAGFVAEFDGGALRAEEDHLACFMGGNLALGGTLLGRPDITAAGLRITAGCHDTYARAPAGLGPERWSWDAAAVPPRYAEFFAVNGWYPLATEYHLRPEVVESYYYAYRLTGDPMYREWAWEAFQAMNRCCRTPSGYSGINNVMLPTGGHMTDFQESFWFAEVLKYLWLIFSDDVGAGVVGVQNGTQEWVFNTEAHPIRVSGY